MLVFCIIHGVQIYGTKNNIEYTEEVLYGDAAAAKGVHFQIPNQFNYIAWMTQGSIDGNLKCETQHMSREELFMKMAEESVFGEDVIKEIIVYRPQK